MRKKACVFLKQIISVLSSIARAKSMAVKNKTSAFKARLIMFSLLKTKKALLGSISDKIHGILGQHDEAISEHDIAGDQSKALVLYNAPLVEDDDDDDKYPDLRHSLFDDDDDNFEDEGGSIIDMVRNSKEEGEEFRLEDEIDHVADLFIMKFHKQMRMQKLESFKRYQDMLERSA